MMKKIRPPSFVLLVIALAVALMVVLMAAPLLAVGGIIAFAMAAGIATARKGKGVLTILALITLFSTVLAAWLWRIAFRRANADLPELPWTSLWMPLAGVATITSVVFYVFYLKQRQAHSRPKD